MGDSSASVVAAAQAGKTTVENNALSTNQLSAYAERARSCQGSGCESVVREMITLSAEQQVDIAVLCTTNPKQCQQKYGYLVEQWPAFDAMIKHMAADGSLPNDFRDALTPTYAQGIEAQGIMASPGWTERFEAMGANKDVAEAMAATLPLLISGAKGSRGSNKVNSQPNVNPYQIKENIAVSQKGNSASNFGKYLEKEKLVNPANNKIVTEHTIVSSGKAPKTSAPNSVYEVSRADGTKSITYYDDKGRTFSREDFGQQKNTWSIRV